MIWDLLNPAQAWGLLMLMLGLGMGLFMGFKLGKVSK